MISSLESKSRRFREKRQVTARKSQRREAYLWYAAATSRCSATQKLAFLRNRQNCASSVEPDKAPTEVLPSVMQFIT